jgi:hypothetical protein
MIGIRSPGDRPLDASGRLGFFLVRKRPESIKIPYKEFEEMLYELSYHSEEIKKFRKPIVQRPE